MRMVWEPRVAREYLARDNGTRPSLRSGGRKYDAQGTRPDCSSMLLVHGDAFVAELNRFRTRARVRTIGPANHTAITLRCVAALRGML